jgi:hypothetical protein
MGAALRGKRVAVLEPIAYGGYKDANLAKVDSIGLVPLAISGCEFCQLA